MWYPPPWGYPMMYPPQTTPTGSPEDAVKMARRWKKFLKQEEKEVKKEEKKEEHKHKTWNAFEIALMLTCFGPFIGLLYAWMFMSLVQHVLSAAHQLSGGPG